MTGRLIDKPNSRTLGLQISLYLLNVGTVMSSRHAVSYYSMYEIPSCAFGVNCETGVICQPMWGKAFYEGVL